MKKYRIQIADLEGNSLEEVASKLASHFATLARYAGDHREADHHNDPNHMDGVTVSEVVS